MGNVLFFDTTTRNTNDRKLSTIYTYSWSQYIKLIKKKPSDKLHKKNNTNN